VGRKHSQLYLLVLGFGVAAPRAMQGTAFEEDVGAQAGAVVQAVPLHVEDDAFDALVTGTVGGRQLWDTIWHAASGKLTSG
jgi:hypothetical protein